MMRGLFSFQFSHDWSSVSISASEEATLPKSFMTAWPKASKRFIYKTFRRQSALSQKERSLTTSGQ